MMRFKKLPSVLIQDPVKDCAYHIPSSELRNFKLQNGSSAYVSEGMITFVIPDDEFMEVTPPFNSTGSAAPNVMIQMMHDQTAYFITYDDLQKFQVDTPQDYGGYGISFVIPYGNEYLEALSPAQLAVLQTGECAFGPGSLWVDVAKKAREHEVA